MGRIELNRTGHNLQRLWWFHDGLWFQQVAQRFGYEAANGINLTSARAVARRAMRLVARVLPKTPLTIEQLAEYCDGAAKLMWAPSMMKWRGPDRRRGDSGGRV